VGTLPTAVRRVFSVERRRNAARNTSTLPTMTIMKAIARMVLSSVDTSNAEKNGAAGPARCGRQGH
jgi:hypothetical protein